MEYAIVGVAVAIFTFFATNFFRSPKEQSNELSEKINRFDKDLRELREDFHSLKYQLGSLQHLTRPEIEAMLSKELRPVVDSIKDLKKDLESIRGYILDMNKPARQISHVA